MDPEFTNQIYRWRDHWSQTIDARMISSFSDLELKINKLVEAHALSMVTPLSGMDADKFSKTYLTPTIQEWVNNQVTPIVENAFQDLQNITIDYERNQINNSVQNIDANGTASAGDFIGPVTTMIAGVMAAVAGTVFAITSFLGFIIAINWPLLIAGLVVGGIAFLLGILKMSDIKKTVGDRFSEKITPSIRESLIGETFKGSPSLRLSIVNNINTTADRVIREYEPNR